jgi:hypothetical protein
VKTFLEGASRVSSKIIKAMPLVNVIESLLFIILWCKIKQDNSYCLMAKIPIIRKIIIWRPSIGFSQETYSLMKKYFIFKRLKSIWRDNYQNVHKGTTVQVTTKKTKISEENLVRENMKSLSNSVTKFCDQGICEGFYFFRH